MINSKDAVIIIIGFILSIFLLFASDTLKNPTIILAVSTGIAILIIYMRLKEAEKDIITISEENKKIAEKLKIHEHLIDIRADIKELQKKVFEK